MNNDLNTLQPYPFERLNALKAGITPADKAHIALSIGEPKHEPPAFVLNTLRDNLDRISVYPKTKGTESLRTAIARWLENRFKLGVHTVDENTQVLPLNGTREGLFSFIQAAVNRNHADTKTDNAKVLMPNPFYQIYEGAALLAGAEPVFLNCLPENNYIPNFNAITEQTWHNCQVLILCSPGNPTGAVISEETLIQLITLADKYDFIIASDECYSEIYFDEEQPPTGLLEACRTIGRMSYERCVVFHSLSKRSNLPGLRSGFIAGDANIIKAFLQYRTYHGCAMSEPVQMASTLAWSDETHVIANRLLYRRKFERFLDILDGCLDVSMPNAAFYLWPRLPDDDQTFCRKLFEEEHITALPGQFLSRQAEGTNPGANHARLALVATEIECAEAAQRLKAFVNRHYG
ncbi:LL-diaminopimelate aminotransferase [BD1-7 clade bacterium]|uniref:LL-diaminopimelate aminotransferase n=1 Tax=BD1-7 clade bacterium TaxID=2029982 RepID=A0A5S9QDP4_9GAMM|nr:LL-diaminopimelate aminotransferase [BD1-7 clade bacterium]